MNKLHPGARWKFRTAFYVRAALFGVVIFFLFYLVLGEETFGGMLVNMSIFNWIQIIVFLIITMEIYTRLSYRVWKYEFNPNELRIESGAILRRYHSIPYVRIQNVEIKRGIFARIFGFSTLNIITAGYSTRRRFRDGISSEGIIPALSVKDAETIRKWLIERITS